MPNTSLLPVTPPSVALMHNWRGAYVWIYGLSACTSVFVYRTSRSFTLFMLLSAFLPFAFSTGVLLFLRQPVFLLQENVAKVKKKSNYFTKYIGKHIQSPKIAQRVPIKYTTCTYQQVSHVSNCNILNFADEQTGDWSTVWKDTCDAT